MVTGRTVTCEFGFFITISASMAPLPLPCFRDFIANVFVTMWNFVYSGLLHRAGALFNEADFDGDENAIVDFKYSSSPKITWWFDHHESAFLTPADAAHFEQDQSNRKFYDPDSSRAPVSSR